MKIPLKYLSRINKSTLSEETAPDFTFRYVDISAVGQGTMSIPDDLVTFAEAPSRARRLASPGDTVISTVRTYLRAVCDVPRSADPLVFSTGFTVVSSDASKVDPKFMTWRLQADDFITSVEAVSTGVSYPATTAGDIGRLTVDLPSLPAQQAIADFLHRETAKIDVLIAKQERLVSMLGLHREAVISTASTECLAGKGWPVDKLGRRARIGNGSTPRRENGDFWADGSIPWLNSSVVNLDEVRKASAFVTAVAMEECHLPWVQAGSLLVGLTGQGRTRGMATITGIDATINQHLAFVDPSTRHWHPQFLLWQIMSAYSTLRAVSDENGSTKGGLTCEDLARLRVVMPPIDEQRRIAEEASAAVAKVDRLINKASELIATMKERRAALITAAVTGQLDVATYGKGG